MQARVRANVQAKTKANVRIVSSYPNKHMIIVVLWVHTNISFYLLRFCEFISEKTYNYSDVVSSGQIGRSASRQASHARSPKELRRLGNLKL